MKVFFDTNVYVAEALLGEAAEEMLAATERAGWRVFASAYLLDELERVLTERLGFSRRLAVLSRQRTMRRARLVEPGASRHEVPQDPGTKKGTGTFIICLGYKCARPLFSPFMKSLPGWGTTSMIPQEGAG